MELLGAFRTVLRGSVQAICLAVLLLELVRRELSNNSLAELTAFNFRLSRLVMKPLLTA